MANLTTSDLVSSGALPPPVLEACVDCIRARNNVLITGITGAGKTTLLHALTGLLAPDEPLLALDSADELRFQNPHWDRVRNRGTQPACWRQCVARALSVAPRRLVAGNLCPPETGEILRALRGRWQAGSLLAVGAGSADAALQRLAAWAALDGFALESAPRTLADLIEIAVCVHRDPDGSRRITATRVVPAAAAGWALRPL